MKLEKISIWSKSINDNKAYLVRILKIIIFIISLLFIAYISYNNYDNIKESLIFDRKNILLELLFLSLVYAISLIFVAIAWQNILSLLSNKKLSLLLILVWLKSNIYKYLPGNIFNYVYRQLISKKMGVSHKVLLESNIVEAILIISTSILISSIILLLVYDFTFNEYFSLINTNYIYIVISFFITVFWYLYKYRQIKVINYWKSIACYMIFFIGIGGSVYFVLNYQMNIEFSFLLITAIYTFAWLVGFITPGASGGIGVREGVFIILLHGVLGEVDAVILSAILRFVSIIGEVILFVIASIMLKNIEELK